MKKANHRSTFSNAFAQRASSTYRFRAECATDAQLVRGLLRPWLQSWKDSQCATFLNEELYYLGDTEVTVTLVPEGPSFSEVVWLIDELHNCHVAGDTFAPVSKYTGERTYRRQFVEPARKPPAMVLQTALNAIKSRELLLELELARAKYIAKRHCEGLEQADTPNALTEDLTSPGWLVCIEATAAGVTAVRSVAAMDGDTAALICGLEQPKARQHTLIN